MNTDLMKQAFLACISRQPGYPDFLVVEHRREAHPGDLTEATVVMHSSKDLPELLKKKIIGFCLPRIKAEVVEDAATCTSSVKLTVTDRPIVLDE